MEQQDWTCTVCAQPNTADAVACINCDCPIDVSSLEIKQRRLVYEKSHAGTKNRPDEANAFISADGRTHVYAPFTVTPDESAKSYKALGFLTSIILRTCWLGIFLSLAIAGFFYFGTYYFEPYKTLNREKLALFVDFQLVMFLLVIPPSIAFGLLPVKIIDKRPLIVRFFYKVTILVLVLLLLAWSMGN
ncbi:MAG: hypothetical protein Q8K62_11565 [Thiobacillus sp.]|nr:hypothetical protein [Thiobacillus sp.]